MENLHIKYEDCRQTTYKGFMDYRFAFGNTDVANIVF